MTWREFVAAVVAALAWPAVIVLAAVLIRRDLRRSGWDV